MIRVHLYGKLRRFARDAEATSDSVVEVPHQVDDTVMSVIARIGIAVEDLGSNLFLNGRYATLETPVTDGDRLGLFPVDMQLLYKWYFAPTGSSDSAAASSSSVAPRPNTGDPKTGRGEESES